VYGDSFLKHLQVIAIEVRFLLRKVCILTATRAEFGLFRPIIEAINRNDNLELVLIVTGTHLLDKYGKSINGIYASGYKVDDTIFSPVLGENRAEMVRNVGEIILGMIDIFGKHSPDIMLLLGDRGEQLAAAIAATYLKVPIAHIHGGDLSGNVDEPVRHAISKLSHIHFAACQDSANRLAKLGEEEWRIHTTGAPGVDNILSYPIKSKERLQEKYGVSLKQEYALLVQHSIPYKAEFAADQLSKTIQALKEFNIKVIAIFPNSDAGGNQIIQILEELRNDTQFTIFKTLPVEDYLSVLKYCTLMIGNSSSGIIEASSFKIPVINVGDRQQGRLRAENVIDVPVNKKRIREAIDIILKGEMRKILEKVISPYGDGRAGPRIAKILSQIDINEKLLRKKMTY
jgi:UDP-N-acetylglucosamine 2-epimerase (non-hydrolysing)/GDP/UDP-N,N'-diacetylbacillosamine 2-epimerase (hydrolysing)